MLNSIRQVVSGVARGRGSAVPAHADTEIVRLEAVGKNLPERRGLNQPCDDILHGRLIEVMGGGSTAGFNVNQNTAIGMPAVTACVTILANMVAKLPIYLYRDTKQGPVEIEDHQSLYLLSKAPGGMHTSFELRHLMETGKGLGGNGYARVIRDGAFDPIAIQWLPPADVQPQCTEKPNGEKFVVYRVKGVNQLLTRADIIHVKLFSTDGVCGVSPIYMARESIGTALSQTSAAGALMKNGAKFGGLLTTDQQLAKEALTDARDEFNKNYSGAINAGRIPVLNGSFKFQAVNGMSMVDAQFVESRKFEIHEVARIYNIPLFMLDSTASTAWGSGIESLNLTFLNNTLEPHLRSWEESLNYTLLTTEELRTGYRFQFDRDEIANAGLDARAKFYQAMRLMGVYSPNDIRAKMGEPLLSDEQGGNTYGAPLASNAAPATQPQESEPVEA